MRLHFDDVSVLFLELLDEGFHLSSALIYYGHHILCCSSETSRVGVFAEHRLLCNACFVKAATSIVGDVAD